MARFVLALDQGTTSSRAILFDAKGRVAAVDQHEFQQHFPKPGWVEHDAEEILATQLRAARGALANARAHVRDVAAIGITNQRETTLVWERKTGRPIHRAIVWKSRQTAPICEELRRRGLEEEVRAKTGLLTRVTGLSGYAKLPDGRIAAFSVLANGYRGSDEAAMKGLDRFVAELVAATPAIAR